MSVARSMSDVAPRSVRASAVPALAKGEIAGLDGLRALSVLSVMVAHFGFGSIVPGGLGVTTFFFISGFLITTLMLREAHATGSVAIGRFYVRRILRLQPELWALLLISGLGGIAFNAWPTMLDTLSGLFYVSNYAKIGAFTAGVLPEMRWPQLWSLAVEEHYYLTYPLLLITLVKMPVRLMAALIVVLVGALALRFCYFVAGADTDLIYSATETRIDSIAYGCVASLVLWYLPEGVARFSGANRAAIASFAIVVLGASVVFRDPLFRDTLRYSVQGGALLLLALSLYCGTAQGLGMRMLELPMLKWMGRMSYGAYLWHLEVGSTVEHMLHLRPDMGPSAFAAALATMLMAASFALAWISYELFQRPVLALRHRFGAEATAPVPTELSDVMQQVQSDAMPAEFDRRR